MMMCAHFTFRDVWVPRSYLTVVSASAAQGILSGNATRVRVASASVCSHGLAKQNSEIENAARASSVSISVEVRTLALRR
jgi:hypothetical protein